MSWGKWKELVSDETRFELTRRHKERVAWSERAFPDLPPTLVLQSLPRLRAQHGKNGVTREMVRQAVERKQA